MPPLLSEQLLPEAGYDDMFWSLAGLQGAERGRAPGFSWTSSRHPVWGRACYGLDLGGAGELTALAAKARELGCLVRTGPACRPNNAEALLEDAGFRRVKSSAGMVLDREEFKPRLSVEGLSVARPGTEADWLSWASLLCAHLFGKTGPGDAPAFAEIGQALASSGRFAAFLGKTEAGEAAATSAVLRGGEGRDGVFFIAVRPASRRRGYWAALASAAVASSFASGAGRVTLGATAEGQPVYERLGFRAVSVMGLYAPPPAGS